MRALRPLLGLIVALALTLGTTAAWSRAGGMAEMAGDRAAASLGTGEPMRDRMPCGCPDCADDGEKAACARAACGLAVAILPHGWVPDGGAPAALPPAPGRVAAANAPRSTDPPPPRSSSFA